MPLPAALLARLARRGIVNTGKGEKQQPAKVLFKDRSVIVS